VLIAEYGQVDQRTNDSDNDEGNGYPLAGRDPAGVAGPEPPDGGEIGRPTPDDHVPPGRAARPETELDDLEGALAAYRSNLGYGTATPIQHAAAYALEHHTELVPPTVAIYRARRDAMAAAFRRAGWAVPVPQATMYYWLPVPEALDDWTWVNTLMDNDGIVVTPGVAFGDAGRGFFRISMVRDEKTLAWAAEKIAARRTTVAPAGSATS